MDHFPIVQALARAALANPTDAVRRQIERLRDALQQAGEADQAKALAGLLSKSSGMDLMTPSRLIRSAAMLAGEELTSRTPLPVDKESANPLATILFSDALPKTAPVLAGDLEQAVRVVLDEWARLDVLESAGVSPSRSCLIYGAPGTGKTQLALWMARQIGLPVVVARLDGLISSFLGTTARNIGGLFGFAARYRCVLLLDEFDAVAKLRDDPQEVGEIKRVVNALLQNLDVRKEIGLTIGITNHEGLLDPAIWRRFDIQLSIPRPTFDARMRIAKAHAAPLEPKESTIKFLAWLSEGTTGAEIELLLKSLRKRVALAPEYQDSSALAAARDFLALHSGRLDPARRRLVMGAEEQLAKALAQDPQLDFSTTETTEILGRSRKTVGRWINNPTRIAQE